MKILSEGGIYFGATLLERGLPFVLMPFLTRALSTEEYGLISIFITVVALTTILIGLGLDGFIRVIFHKSDRLEFNSYVRTALSLASITLLIVSSVFALVYQSISEYTGLSSLLILLVLLLSLSQVVTNVALAIYQTQRMPMHYAKIQIFRPALDLLLVSILIFLLSGGGTERIFSLVIASSITALVCLLLLIRRRLIGWDIDKSRVNRALRFVLPLFSQSLMITAVFTFDKIFLSSNLGLSFLGELAVALALGSPTLIVAESINRAFMPWSYAKYKENQLHMVVGASYVLLLGMLSLCVAYSLFLYFAFGFLVGQNFEAALGPALIMVWIGWLKLAYFTVAKSLQYTEYTVHRPFISLFAGAIYFGLLVLNRSEIELTDVAIYMLVFHILVFLITAFVSQKKFPQPWHDIGSVGRVLNILMVNVFNNNLLKLKKKKFKAFEG